MILCKWHSTRIKPAVYNFRYTMHLFAAFRTRNRKIIDVRSVKFYRKRILTARQIVKFLPASDRMPVTAFTFPHIKRCSPISVTRNRPVLNVLKPVSETSRSDGFGDPVDGVVVPYKVIPDLGHFYIPGFPRIIDKRSRTSPAMGIVMFYLRGTKKYPSCIKLFEDFRICTYSTFVYFLLGWLGTHTPERSLRLHHTFFVHHLDKRCIIFSSDSGIIFTKRGSNMNYSGTIRHCYIVITVHKERFLVLCCGTICGTFVKRLIFLVFEIASLIRFQNLICRSSLCPFNSRQNRIGKGLGKNISISIRSLNLNVCIIWIDTKSDITCKSPRRCCPRKEICVFVFDLKPYNCRSFF